jgi:hypothetical protein
LAPVVEAYLLRKEKPSKGEQGLDKGGIKI